MRVAAAGDAEIQAAWRELRDAIRALYRLDPDFATHYLRGARNSLAQIAEAKAQQVRQDQGRHA